MGERVQVLVGIRGLDADGLGIATTGRQWAWVWVSVRIKMRSCSHSEMAMVRSQLRCDVRMTRWCMDDGIVYCFITYKYLCVQQK